MKYPVMTSRPREITIQQNMPTLDSFGQAISSWTTLKVVWALEVAEISGREAFAAEQVKGVSTIRIRIRYMSSVSVTINNRILYGSRIFDINAVLNVGEQNQYLDLYVKEAH